MHDFFRLGSCFRARLLGKNTQGPGHLSQSPDKSQGWKVARMTWRFRRGKGGPAPKSPVACARSFCFVGSFLKRTGNLCVLLKVYMKKISSTKSVFEKKAWLKKHQFLRGGFKFLSISFHFESWFLLELSVLEPIWSQHSFFLVVYQQGMILR